MYKEISWWHADTGIEEKQERSRRGAGGGRRGAGGGRRGQEGAGGGGLRRGELGERLDEERKFCAGTLDVVGQVHHCGSPFSVTHLDIVNSHIFGYGGQMENSKWRLTCCLK